MSYGHDDDEDSDVLNWYFSGSGCCVGGSLPTPWGADCREGPMSNATRRIDNNDSTYGFTLLGLGRISTEKVGRRLVHGVLFSLGRQCKNFGCCGLFWSGRCVSNCDWFRI
jgi:hypothetical protein